MANTNRLLQNVRVCHLGHLCSRSCITIEKLSELRVLTSLDVFVLKPQSFFGKSDPFLEFYKETATGWLLAHRTEVHASDKVLFLER